MTDAQLRGILGDTDIDEKRGQVQDFVSRYEDGPPTEGFSGEEARERYDQIADKLSPEEYQQAATLAFERMSPEQRRDFAHMLMTYESENGMPVDPGDQMEDPDALARMTSRVQQQQPSGLGALLGGNAAPSGGMLENLLGGSQSSQSTGIGGLGGGLSGMLGGGNQMMGHNRSQSGAGLGDLLNNPIARAAIGGIASMAFRQLLSRR